MHITRAAGILGILSMIGCGGASPTATTDGLSIVDRTATALDGTFLKGAAGLKFSATADNRHVIVTLEIDAMVAWYDLDYAVGQGSFDSNGAVLTAANRATIEAFTLALEKGLATEGVTPDQRPLIEDATINLAGHFAIAPIGEALPPFTFHNEHSWTFLPCGCGSNYIYNSTFAGYKVTGYCSSSSCPGRCGVGCGWDNTWSGWGSGKYTNDCALHDYSLGSWFAASDDYSFAAYNCQW